MAGVVGTHLVAQVGFIVKDVEETKKKWAEFLGLEVPETQPIGDYAVTGTTYKESLHPRHIVGWQSLMLYQAYSWN